MTPLACLTRGDSSPRGKARVYFCCHPDDQSAFLKPLADELLALHDCAVWYDPEPGAPLSPDRREELAQMQLFVVPVTSRFLTSPSPALTEEFPLALEQHIPVLPLLQEPGLEAIFNEKCGDLQCLDPNQTDPTALPYAEKLKKFLDGVLVGDELAAQVRAAFDAYIFLSYRKKDRKEAQALMRLIHENDFCRDIAIWYDEFLTPGEDFNAAITQALEKSGLFVLAVTPHLLEKPNYARDAGKPILPVEMDPTDRAGLEAAYPGIPPCAEAGTLPAGLRDALQGLALRENDADPRHNFFIGLAYLAGIDVEVNKEKGADLIQSAARDGLPEAMEKLADMYRTGDGVKRDHKAAVQWQEKLVDARRAEWEDLQDEAAYTRYSNALWDLGDQYQDLAEMDNARRVWETEFLPLANRGEEQGFAQARRYQSLVCHQLGILHFIMGDMASSRHWFIKCITFCRSIVAQNNTVDTQFDLAVFCNNIGTFLYNEREYSSAYHWLIKSYDLTYAIAQKTFSFPALSNLVNTCISLGNLHQAEGKLPSAHIWFERGEKLAHLLLDKDEHPEIQWPLASIYINLGNLCLSENNIPAARHWFEESIFLSRSLWNETNSLNALQTLTVSCIRMGELYQSENNLSMARHWFEESLSLSYSLSADTYTIESQRISFIVYSKLGELYSTEGRFLDAKQWFTKCLEQYQTLLKKADTAELRRDLSIVYERIGTLCRVNNDFNGARLWFEKSISLRRAQVQGANTIEARRDLVVACNYLGNVYQVLGDLSSARRLYTESLEICLSLADGAKSLQILRDLSVTYSNLGELCRIEEKFSDAYSLFKKELELSETLVKQNNSPKALDDLAVCLYNIGTLPNGDPKILQRAKEIWTCLSNEYPSSLLFSQRLKEVNKVLSI